MLLARLLMRSAGRPDVIVLAFPRGGVLRFQVAAALDAPLDVVMMRKIGMPGYSEYSIGATSGDQPLFQFRAIEVYGISHSISTGDLLVLDYVCSRPAPEILDWCHIYIRTATPSRKAPIVSGRFRPKVDTPSASEIAQS